jgi:hypothetical protein
MAKLQLNGQVGNNDNMDDDGAVVADNIEGNLQHSPEHVEVGDASESSMQQVRVEMLNNSTTGS